MNTSAQDPRPDQAPAKRRAGPLQVAKTMIFGLLAIGMKGTIEKDGARVTPAQLVVGGLIGAAILVALIITLVHFILKSAMS